MKEGRQCLFNDALNTFYLSICDVEHIVKDYGDSERGNLYGLLFWKTKPIAPLSSCLCMCSLHCSLVCSLHWDCLPPCETEYRPSSRSRCFCPCTGCYCNFAPAFSSSACALKRKEGNVLFNDALNTFYLWLYGVGHMVKYHSDSEWKPAATTWATLSD